MVPTVCTLWKEKEAVAINKFGSKHYFSDINSFFICFLSLTWINTYVAYILINKNS